MSIDKFLVYLELRSLRRMWICQKFVTKVFYAPCQTYEGFQGLACEPFLFNKIT